MRVSLAALTLAVVACAREALPPIGQIVLHIESDAPVPRAPGDTSAESTVTLFDTLRIDLYANGAPIEGLSREIALDASMFRDRRASFGIVAPASAREITARLRIYRYARQLVGQPQPRTSLDTTVRVPPVSDAVVTHVAVALRTEDVGRLVGYPEPVDAAPWDANAPAIPPWPHATRVPCTGTAREDEVCIPGGAYWFGGASSMAVDALTLAGERLVVVGPFFVDATEMTAATARAIAPDLLSGSAPRCGAPNDELPIRCVSWDAARTLCQARGMELPTEAQWEWVASGLGADTDWPFGDGPPKCSDANFGSSIECPLWNRVVAPRRFPRDSVTPSPGGPSVFDLAGNVDEWMLDDAVAAAAPPWSSFGVLVDPIGRDASAAGHSVRGGRLGIALAETRVALRRALGVAAGESSAPGLRCVRSAR